MPYTPFIKSYGDFEVVIPAVDFSSLTKYEATEIARSLRTYEKDYVCFHIGHTTSWPIRDAFTQAIDGASSTIRHQGLECYLECVMEGVSDMPNFHPCRPAGRILRRAWCQHMANEVEREFGLKEGRA